MNRVANSRLRSAVCAAVALVALTAESAPSYPVRPVRMILHPQPGTGPDVVARVLAEKIAGEIGQPVVVENRPGASGTIAGELVARANADGYTMLLGTVANLAVIPHLLSKFPYDPLKAFAPIGLIQRGPYVVVVHPGIPARNLHELIAHAKANPEKLNFGTPGLGSTHHLVWELFMMRTAAKLVHIPYRGAAQALTETVAGRVHLYMGGPNLSVTQNVEAGKLQYIALTGASRSERLPTVRTMIEQGLPGFEAYQWWGLFMPAGAPREAVARMNSALNSVLAAPQVRKRLHDEGVSDERFATTPQQLGAWVAAEHAHWGKVIRDASIRIE